MSEFDGVLHTVPVVVPGNPFFPTELPGPDDPFQSIIPDYPILSEPAVSGPGGPGAQPGLDGVLPGYSLWFLERLWLTPNPIEFGNIIGSKSLDVTIFSTKLLRQTLETVDTTALGGGVDVTENPPPVTFDFMQTKSLELTATADGPSSFADFVVFEFDTGPLPILSTGRRLVLFWYPPESPVTERVSWLTDILRRRDGTEQRRSLRTAPRSRLEYRVRSEDGEEASALRNLITAFRSFQYGLPVWHEQRQVTAAVGSGASVIPVATADVDHRVGATIMLWEPLTRTFFDREVASFDASSITLTEATTVDISAAALVLPVRLAYIGREPRFDDHAAGALDTLLEFETNDNIDLAFADQTALEVDFPVVHPVNDLPILVDDNLMASDRIQRSFRTRFRRLDEQIGTIAQFAEDPLATIDAPKEVDLNSLAEIRAWRSLLHWLRGSWGAFYLPTFRRDLVPTAGFQLDAPTIQVKNVGVANFFGVREPHESVMLELADGRQFFAVIQSAVDAGTVENLTLAAPFGGTTEAVDIATARLSWLELVRVDGDVATFIHRWVGEATLRFNTRTVQQ